jgi:multidrug efflux pump subunit AcrB
LNKLNWAEFSIRNKYTIFALIIGIILFGFFSKTTLKEQLMPNTSPPLVNIITNYPGASAQEVAENVSEILEEEISLVSGVKKVKSTSQNDLSIVKLTSSHNYGSSALGINWGSGCITYN